MRRLRALLLLAWRALVLHPLRVLFALPTDVGKAKFLANYTPEGLIPYSAGERAMLPRFSGCIQCGLCDAICPLLATEPARLWRGPSLFAVAYSRATPELVNLTPVVAVLDRCGTCARCQQLCPRSVPLLEIFAFTRRKLAQVEETRA